MSGPEHRGGAGAVHFRARMTTPASRDSAFEVEDRLSPYELETLALNARAYPAGSRLELVVTGDVSDMLFEDTRRRLAELATRGIGITLRRAAPGEPRNGWRSDMKENQEHLETDKRLVLVADDDPDMRRLVSTLLRMAGHRVIEASDGNQILNRIESTAWRAQRDPVDVIVSDINMPGLSGLDLLAALRCAQWKTPVVLITAFGDDETRIEANELGAAAILDKPFDPEALRNAVASAAAT